MKTEKEITHCLYPALKELREGGMICPMLMRFEGRPVIRVDLAILKWEFEQLEAKIKVLTDQKKKKCLRKIKLKIDLPKLAESHKCTEGKEYSVIDTFHNPSTSKLEEVSFRAENDEVVYAMRDQFEIMYWF